MSINHPLPVSMLPQTISPGSFHKTRLAPTPSGFLHLGNILSFVITAGLARQADARILLRIDDLDRERIHKAYVQDIFDTLHYLNIPWDEGPANIQDYEKLFSQLHRLGNYEQLLLQLKEDGHLFACTCSRAQVLRNSPDGTYPGTCRYKGIPLDKEGVNWRIRTDNTLFIRIKALDGETITQTLPPSMQDFIVRKKDGLPAYQLASLADDLYFNIDLVVRGLDLWDSTLAQLYLLKIIDPAKQDAISFYHHPLLQETNGRKLSKSKGATSIRYLRAKGNDPGAVLTMIGEACGAKESVKSWQELTDRLQSLPGFKSF